MNIVSAVRTTICIFTSLILACTCDSLAQEAKSKQFDFWIGEWMIEQKIVTKSGEWLEFSASTKVKYILDEKAIEENWEGMVQFFWAEMEEPKMMKGYSIRYYGEEENQWLIYWMDTIYPSLSVPYKGNFLKKGYGVFYKSNAAPNGTTYSRITFVQKNEGNVKWELAVSDDKESWSSIWIMNMRKK